MLSDYERAEIRACLRTMTKAWRLAPAHHRGDEVHAAYEAALLSVEDGLRTMLAHDSEVQRGTRRRSVHSRAAITAAKAEKRKRVALEVIAAAPRSLRELLPVLKRNRCCCAPGDLGREMLAWARDGLIVRDAGGRRGGKRWRIAST